MPNYTTQVFIVQSIRGTSSSITIGNGADPTQHLWANPYPTDRIADLIRLDSTTLEVSAALPDATQARGYAQAALATVSASYSPTETALRENHQWNGDTWVDVTANDDMFGYAFAVEATSAGVTSPVQHNAGLGNGGSDGGIVSYCVAVQGTKQD